MHSNSTPDGRTARLALLALMLTACEVDHRRVRSGPEEANSLQLPLTGLTVSHSVSLHRATNGVDGRLELLLDSRLSEARQNELWGTGELEPGDLRFAVLQVVDLTGAVRDRLILERSLAHFEPETVTLPDGALWLLSVDYSASMGSYNGPVTLPLQVQEARLRPLEAVDEQGTTAPVRLMRSLKTDWRLEPARVGPIPDILSVSTRPDFDNQGEFVVTYARLSFDGHRWIRHTRRTPGLWESDGDFPDRELFP
jgi:hypothetical protein